MIATFLKSSLVEHICRDVLPSLLRDLLLLKRGPLLMVLGAKLKASVCSSSSSSDQKIILTDIQEKWPHKDENFILSQIWGVFDLLTGEEASE